MSYFSSIEFPQLIYDFFILKDILEVNKINKKLYNETCQIKLQSNFI